MLRIFKSKDSSDDVKGYAAYYLGILYTPEAVFTSEVVDTLASQMTLNLPRGGHLSIDESQWRMWPVVGALVNIGTPSIPAMIRNVSTSDDAEVVKLSLQVLCRIDGDKDIVRLRLQKALEKEPDKTKQTRLQTALTALETVKF